MLTSGCTTCEGGPLLTSGGTACERRHCPRAGPLLTSGGHCSAEGTWPQAGAPQRASLLASLLGSLEGFELAAGEEGRELGGGGAQALEVLRGHRCVGVSRVAHALRDELRERHVHVLRRVQQEGACTVPSVTLCSVALRSFTLCSVALCVQGSDAASTLHDSTAGNTRSRETLEALKQLRHGKLAPQLTVFAG